jgi:hypothetical protein
MEWGRWRRNVSEGYVIFSPTQLIISLLLTLADRQHV